MLPSQYTNLKNAVGLLSLDNQGRITSISGSWLAKYSGRLWSEITFRTADSKTKSTVLLDQLAVNSADQLVTLHLAEFEDVMARCSKSDNGYSLTLIRVESKETSSSLKDVISTFIRTHNRITLIILDCEDIFSLNSAIGYENTDRELFNVSDALHRITAQETEAVFFTISPGHYALISPQLKKQEAIDLYEILKSAVRTSSEYDIKLNASCTIAQSDNLDLDTLLLTSESLLDISKQSSKYELQMAEVGLGSSVNNSRLELERALRKSQFRIFYQPILDLSNMQLASVEALARWDHPDKGIVGPDDFIDKLHKYRLMRRFGRFLVDQVVADIKRWGRNDIPVSINVSPNQLANTEFVNYLINHTQKNGVLASQIQVEITEDSACSEVVSRSVAKLRREGFSVAIDDFGTGYSNIVSLRTMAFNAIKIDKSLLSDVAGKLDDQAGFFTKVVQMCKSVSNSVVVEGIESSEQEQLARSSGATFVQGFLYARPMQTTDLESSPLWRVNYD